MLISKFTSTGNLVYGRIDTIQQNTGFYYKNTTCDNKGNLIVTLDMNGDRNYRILKYSPAGLLKWNNTIAALGSSQQTAPIVYMGPVFVYAQNNNIYLSALFSNSFQLLEGNTNSQINSGNGINYVMCNYQLPGTALTPEDSEENKTNAYKMDLSGSENSLGTVTVSPNPATDFVTVSSKGEAITHVNIYNYSGVLVISVSTELSEVKVDLGVLPNGMYIIESTDKLNNKAINKFVKN